MNKKPKFTDREVVEKKGHSGTMIALYMPQHVQKAIAHKGGEKPKDLHVTLAYFPKVGGDKEHFDGVSKAMSNVASDFGQVEGNIGGIGCFNPTDASDGKRPYYASFNSPVLPSLHTAVHKELEKAGYEPSRMHGFTPHVTLKYLDEDEAIPDAPKNTGKFRIPHISVKSGKFENHIPLTGHRILKSADLVDDLRAALDVVFKYHLGKEPFKKDQPGGSDVHVDAPLNNEDELDKDPKDHGVVTPSVANLEAEIIKAAYRLPPDMDEEEEQEIEKEGIAFMDDVEPSDVTKLKPGTPVSDAATANDADPRVGIDSYSQLPDDAFLAADALGYYWSDSTSSGQGNRAAGYPSQGGLAKPDDAEEANNEIIHKDVWENEENDNPDVQKDDLNAKGRDQIADDNFALPGRRYPIHDIAHARNALARVAQHGSEEEKTKVRSAVHRKYPSLGERAEKIEKMFEGGRTIPIAKANKAKQIVYCVVLAPDELDAQDDWMTEEDIEDAAHSYLLNSRVIGSNHEQPIDASPVESYVAPQDLHWEDGLYGPQMVKKGSWIIGIKVHDPKEWSKVEDGEYQGVSVGGEGRRT